MESADKQLKVLLEGAEQVYTADELARRLEESVAQNRPLRVKLGMDPTAPDLHLGHCVVLEKMRQFQDLGHKAVLIIGDYTAMIGDPTGQNKTRPMLLPEQIEQNARTYFEQAGKVLDTSPEKLEIRHNNEWFSKMNLADAIRLTSRMTAAQMLQRRDFKERFAKDIDIALSEFTYPLLQGWDSVVVRSDVELGGTDQLFNNLVGRELQREEKQPPQIVMVLPILEGLDGVEKMSKSKGNYIGVAELPKEMFGKAMSISDELMWKWYRLLLHKSGAELAELRKGHPMEAKKALASATVERFHGSAAAAQARAEFESVFSKRQLPSDMPEVKANENPIGIVKLIVECKLAPSNSEARRLVQQGAVHLGEHKVTDVNERVTIQDGLVLQVGKRKFVRIRV
jgi:tyrosyl-tRNA synthetase